MKKFAKILCIHAHAAGEGWTGFRPFATAPAGPTDDVLSRLVDLDGDGLADLLVTTDDALVWHEGQGADGFGEARRILWAASEEAGPRLVRATLGEVVHCADMTGDGLSDIVRVRNGEIAYWPNLGHGRFGAKILMDNAPRLAPREAFDPARVLLADIDGTGTTDLIYLAPGRVQIAFNQSGNGWSRLREVAAFPNVAGSTAVGVSDLLGNGTACLVWASPLAADAGRHIRYVDLMGGKPHLLVGMSNSCGAQTRIDYAPSTAFYLRDRREGRPWRTKLPFPVPVVERVTRTDHIARTRFVSTYRYSHGSYDPRDREFRGFGMVECCDTDAYFDFAAGVAAIEGTQATDPESFQPPVTTRRWYCTGTLAQGDDVAGQYRDEYFDGTSHLPRPVLPDGLGPRDFAEAVRGLKGLMLREEVFSFDGSGVASLPYSVAESAGEIVLLQPSGWQAHAIVQVLPRESLSLAYDRVLADPRISQTLILEHDVYGRPLKSCSVAYGRRIADPALPAEVVRDQRRTHVSLAEADTTEDLRIGLPLTTFRLRRVHTVRQFEILGITPAGALFKRSEIAGLIAQTTILPYVQDADPAKMQRRLTGERRLTFLNDQLASLPLGQWDTLGLPHRSLTLAITADVVATHYAGTLVDADFTAAGYVHDGGDADWWVPSGTVIWPDHPERSFWTPIGSRDPFGIETVATFDRYGLLPERIEVRQADWNVSTAVNDYRLLTPVELADPNGNRSAVRHDVRGIVVATALMGKAGAGDGDTLDNPTLRLDYDLFAWSRDRKPCFVRTLAREQHGVAATRWQESVTHFDGAGGLALVKARANPGPAFTVAPDDTRTEVEAVSRWIGNGRVVLNNKGAPIKRFEPYFSTTDAFEDEAQLRHIGVSPIMQYDPVGRLVRTDAPDGTFSRTEFSPWARTSFDPNDTVKQSQWYADRGSPDPATEAEPLKDPDRRAAWLAAKHADTPNVTHFDSLGRGIRTEVQLGGELVASTRAELDQPGRVTRLYDELGRMVSSGFTGMSGIPVMTWSAERGRRFTFLDITGALVRSWDEHGRAFRGVQDALRRPLGVFVQQGGGAERLLSYVIYGDRLADGGARNLLGAAHLVFDTAGMVRVPQADFRGRPGLTERLLCRDYKSLPDWTALIGAADVAAVLAIAMPRLETGEPLSIGTVQDALGRLIRMTLPDGTAFIPAYNERNLVTSLDLLVRGQGPAIRVLKSQDHDARGLRLSALFGNDVTTRLVRDPLTRRLMRLLSHRAADDPAQKALQDLNYAYDAVGNVVEVRDDAQQTFWFNNAVVPALNRYAYDSGYRLVRASGREHAVATNNVVRIDTDLAVASLPLANDQTTVRTYTEEYDYDLLGNLATLRHRFKAQPLIGDGWTRHYRYARDDNPADFTNRLSATSMPGDVDGALPSGNYAHDVYGNMTATPRLAELVWDDLDRLAMVDLGGGGTAFHVYGLGGQRHRRVVERPGNLNLEWIDLGPLRLHRRRRRDTGEIRFARSTIDVGAGGVAAQIDVKLIDSDGIDAGNAINAPVVRYQHGNHLGSATLETNDAGNGISYEEYHPFGTTAYRASRPGSDISLRRYRFAGKERDDGTGLIYFGARYYAPWLGRWISADPAGFVDGFNLFAYCRNNPASLADPNGMETAGYTLPNKPEAIRRAQRTHSEPAGQRYESWLRSQQVRIEEQVYTIEGGTRVWVSGSGGHWELQGATLRAVGSTGSEASAPAGASAQDATPPPATAPPPVDSSAPPPATTAAPPPPSASPYAQPDPPQDTAGPLGNAATAIPGAVTKSVWALPPTLRGTAIDFLAGNNLGLMNESADVLTARNVIQVKSTADAFADTARAATRQAATYIADNPTTTPGRAPQAEVVIPENAPASAEAEIRNALSATTQPRQNGRFGGGSGNRAAISGDPPIASRGLPTRARVAGGGLAAVGLGLSAYAFTQDVRQGDVPMAVGDGVSAVAAGTEIYGLAAGSTAATSLGLGGAGVGMMITSGTRAIREYNEGDMFGAAVDTIGVVGGGMLLAAAIIATGPIAAGLALGGVAICLGVAAFHLLRGH